MGKFRTKQFAFAMFSVFLVSLIFFSVTDPVIYAEDVRDDTINVEALFKKAMKERNAGNYGTSVIIFQSILNSQPELHRARLELAVAYYKLLQFEQALKEAEIVLNSSDTPPDVRVAVLKFISQINSEIK